MHIRLREQRLSDKAAQLAMWGDPRVTYYIGGEPQVPEVIWGKFLSAAGLWPIMGYGYWVFADRANDQLLGVGGLSYLARDIAELEGYPEAGWAIAPEYWGQGYATEAMGAALAWSDQHLSSEVRAIIDPPMVHRCASPKNWVSGALVIASMPAACWILSVDRMGADAMPFSLSVRPVRHCHPRR